MTRIYASSLLLREWADLSHLVILDEMVKQMPWKMNEILFHGGTNLHLSWSSPRKSEDLDFLLNQEGVQLLDPLLNDILPLVELRLRAFRPEDDLQLELRNKTRPEKSLQHYQWIISSPRYLGVSRVKTEFWQVAPGYIERIERDTLKCSKRLAGIGASLASDLPISALRACFADKLLAISNRKALKWRDLFDLWWIGARTHPAQLEQLSQRRVVDHNWEQEARDLLHHATAYATIDGAPVWAGFSRLIEADPGELLIRSHEELQRWLPEALWHDLYPDKVQQMIHFAKHVCQQVQNTAKQLSTNTSQETDHAQRNQLCTACPTSAVTTSGVVRLR